MAIELAPRTGLIGRPRSNGLDLPPDLTFYEWAGALHHAELLVEAGPWFLVDLMAYGEAHFGERHTQALPTAEEDPTGASQSRLKQAAWMASVYPPGTRVTGLSYSHHRAVAELEPEDRSALLQEAVATNLSTRDLIARVKQRQADARAVPAASAPVCAADAVWVPSKDDLLPEQRAALERAALAANLDDPSGFSAGWIAALIHTQQELCFRPDRWRD